MNNAVKFNLSDSELNNLKKLSVKALVLFGSQAQGLGGVKSDFDIGVIINNSRVLYNADERKRIYDTLYDILAAKINKLVDIDIVFLEMAPAELQAHVMKYGKVVFEDSPNIFSDFKARIMEQYADFAPLREIFYRGIFSRIR